MTYYNLSVYENVSDISGLFISSNYVTDAWFSYLMMLLYYIIIFLMYKSYDTKMVFFTSSILLSFVSTLLFLASFVTIYVVGVALALVAASTLIFVWGGD